ncbi:other/FunK1 protein kinase [Coprinopsis cinerea okayama7|uniref:Other/FunK1 protein kinase n=1 Tax=Coprinopsis cinerea (strain Okayama-7 / 130 / ATCC MYA-4618 / FGSC 9003) TaxID=240176 RepID=A8NB62_COPC7|nr:other/FunK1 protein kinase [Coprinopsis cinerea okayama7\|eukprot:XP_001832063.2 other/FunK1 protein kinase [Coprinopsis cinerea okayama7\
MDSPLSVCEVEDFVKTYLPNDHLANFDSVMEYLKDQKVLAPRGSSLAQYPSPLQRRPVYTHALKAFRGLFRARHAKPATVVKSLKAIGTAVRKALEKVKAAGINECSIRSSEVQGPVINACLTANVDSAFHPTNMAVPLRVAADEEKEEPMEALPRLFDVINSDARRTFTYAITVQRDKLSIWYLSRSLCVRSTPFNMTEHPDLLIQALTCIMLATPEQLGYDPLVTLLPDLSYVYELPPDHNRANSLYYRTTELISQYHSADTAGRSTRVWRVKQVTSSARPVDLPGASDMVLKHVSVDATMPTEREVQEQLFSDISAFGKLKNWRENDVLKEMPKDDLDVLAEALKGDNFRQLFSCIIAHHVGEPASTPSTEAVKLSKPRCPKRKCFFVYELLCTPLSKIPTLGEAIDVIKQCVTALRLMWCAGWVHRDVSIGNILAFRPSQDSPWEVRLTDLEHARRFPDPNVLGDDTPIGTPYFMPVELQNRGYYFPALEERPKERKTWFPVKPLVHNYQHDLESIWWIILWLITGRTTIPVSRAFADRYFRNKDAPSYGASRSFLLSGQQSILRDREFPTSLPPRLYQGPSFLTHLDDLKINLHVEYTSRNRVGKQDDRRSYAWIVGEGASDFFNDIEDSRMDWGGIELLVAGNVAVNDSASSAKGSSDDASWPERPKPPPKRRIDDDDTDDEDQRPPPRKKVRVVPVRGFQALVQRAGPVTRSMARNQRPSGPTTRSTTRRLQQEAAENERSKLAKLPARRSRR